MYLRPRMTRFGGHAGPYVWGGVTGVTDRDNPWLTAVQQNTATRLVVQAKSYDAEQRFLVNENPLSVRTALGVGLGASGCAGPIFAVDKDGSCVWIDQKLATVDYARIYCTTPSFTDGTIFTVEGVTSTQPTSAATEIVFRFVDVGLDVYGYMFNGRLGYHDDIASTTSATNVQTLLGLNDWDLFAFRFAVSGTSLIVQVRKLSDVSWTNVLSGSTVTAADVNGGVFYLGHNSTGSVRRGKYQNLALRDGDESAVKIAEFTPSMFVGGNRADGDTAVDAYGVTWTIERPAATTDMPTVNTSGGLTYLTFDGVNDFAQVVGDDTITSFVPATGLTVLLDAAFGSGAASGAVFASSANATTDDGIIISRSGANERIQGRVDDGTTVASVGDNADNITYDTRFQAAFAFGNSDHEAYVDGVSVETATDAVGSVAAAGALRLGAEIDGSNKAAFDLYAFAVVGDDMSDTEVAATAAEGLAI